MNPKDYIYVVETIEAVKGKTEELKIELLKLVPLSQSEEGCVFYDLHQDRNLPQRFLVLMCWETQEAYEKHNASDFINQFVEKFDNILYWNVVEDLFRKITL
ncbi:MAG: antibiotic biosynthesis monooxygenase [Verrucomicrobia bacterium]|nr:antibiotic biosynthesis monooxygenase [Verrucomicrobiota bacterium]